uniref:PRKR-interacting protein 1 n=1 Tax=Anopheles farauti TaxID=69004 RepID=A0A182QKD6_9DIPT
MEIRNEVKQKDNEVEKKKFVVRNAADIQRAKLEKLMKNPDKPVIIPAPSRNRDFSTAIPSFVRNVMGSSAGAGSGEFHVYRHLRRKEYARQKQIQEKSHAEQLNDAFQQKLENNRKAAEERTAKKRNKRLKKKAAKRNRVQQKHSEKTSERTEDSSEESDNDDTDGEKNDGKSQETEELKESSNGKESEHKDENVEAKFPHEGNETVTQKLSSTNDANEEPVEEPRSNKEADVVS